MRCASSTAIWKHLWERCHVVIWICPLAPVTFVDVLIGKRPQGAKGYFQDYQVGTNPVVLLIVLRLWEVGVCVPLLWPKCLLPLGAILGEGTNQDPPGAQGHKTSAQRKYFPLECTPEASKLHHFEGL